MECFCIIFSQRLIFPGNINPDEKINGAKIIKQRIHGFNHPFITKSK